MAQCDRAIGEVVNVGSGSEISIGDLVRLYFEEGKAEHVRPELAFAQSIIETGSFGNALDNNYAGIGACDSCLVRTHGVFPHRPGPRAAAGI